MLSFTWSVHSGSRGGVGGGEGGGGEGGGGEGGAEGGAEGGGGDGGGGDGGGDGVGARTQHQCSAGVRGMGRGRAREAGTRAREASTCGSSRIATSTPVTCLAPARRQQAERKPVPTPTSSTLGPPKPGFSRLKSSMHARMASLYRALRSRSSSMAKKYLQAGKGKVRALSQGPAVTHRVQREWSYLAKPLSAGR